MKPLWHEGKEIDESDPTLYNLMEDIRCLKEDLGSKEVEALESLMSTIEDCHSEMMAKTLCRANCRIKALEAAIKNHQDYCDASCCDAGMLDLANSELWSALEDKQ